MYITPTTTIQLAKQMLGETIWSAANVESLSVTLPQTETMVKYGIISDVGVNVIEFILNTRRAWYWLFNNLSANIDYKFISQLNEIISGNSDYKCPDSNVIAQARRTLSELSEISSVANRALETFCYLCRAQIFSDYNKCIAELTTNKILIEAGLGIFRVPVSDMVEFRTLLFNLYESGSRKKDLLNFLKSKCIITDELRLHANNIWAIYQYEFSVPDEVTEWEHLQSLYNDINFVSVMNKVEKDLLR